MRQSFFLLWGAMHKLTRVQLIQKILCSVGIPFLGTSGTEQAGIAWGEGSSTTHLAGMPNGSAKVMGSGINQSYLNSV